MRQEMVDLQQKLRLDDMSPEEIEEQTLAIDYWVDEIQENAMTDAPIIIFFCTDRKK